jgi:nucleotide-binding universal stress UspA family protein
MRGAGAGPDICDGLRLLSGLIHSFPSLMKNLLVPTDFSPESHHAFGVALQLAGRIGAGVTLLHVLAVPETAGFSTYGGPVEGDGGRDDVFMIQLLQATKRRMHGLLNEASRTAPNVTVHDMVLTDSTGPAILQAIETQGIDLVVIGAQTHSAMDHLLNGSHTEELVRLAPCPVLTVKYAVGEFAPRRILFPSDFTPEADKAVAGLRQVQAIFPDAELHLLQVVEAEAEVAAAQARILAFAERHDLKHAHPAVFSDDSPVSGISAYARQMQADLLVVPTHGRIGLSRFLHTSIAETVATHAFPPVLTFKLV